MNEIRQEITNFLKSCNPKDYLSDAVNWSDLRCTSIGRVQSWSGQSEPDCYILITIEEASPDSSGIHRAVEKLCETLLPGEVVEVHTEW